MGSETVFGFYGLPTVSLTNRSIPLTESLAQLETRGKPQVNGLALTYHSSPTTGWCSCWIWLTAINQPNCRHLERYQLEKAWGRMWAQKQQSILFLMGWRSLGNSCVFCIWQLEVLFWLFALHSINMHLFSAQSQGELCCRVRIKEKTILLIRKLQ